jgi:hypothetical protein
MLCYGVDNRLEMTSTIATVFLRPETSKSSTDILCSRRTTTFIGNPIVACHMFPLHDSDHFALSNTTTTCPAASWFPTEGLA